MWMYDRRWSEENRIKATSLRAISLIKAGTSKEEIQIRASIGCEGF